MNYNIEIRIRIASDTAFANPLEETIELQGESMTDLAVVLGKFHDLSEGMKTGVV